MFEGILNLEKLILENVNDFIWIIDVSTGKYLYSTGNVKHVTGREPEEYLQMTMADSVPPHSLNIALDITEKEVNRFLRGEATEHPEITFDLEIYYKDNSLLWVEISSRIIRDSLTNDLLILGISHPIQERKELELELKHTKEWFSLITNNIADMMFVISVETLAFEFAMGNTLEILGYTNEECVGKFLHESVADISFREMSRIISEKLMLYYKDGDSSVTENYMDYYHYHKNGKLIHMECSSKMTFNEDNTPKHIISINRRARNR